MSEDQGLSPLGTEMVAGLAAFCDTLESGVPIEKRFTVRTVHLDFKARPYLAEDVKNVRATLNVSQALLARFLGVSVKSVRSWEQGTRRVPTIACRFLDEILAHPDLWNRRLAQAVTTEKKESVES